MCFHLQVPLNNKTMHVKQVLFLGSHSVFFRYSGSVNTKKDFLKMVSSVLKKAPRKFLIIFLTTLLTVVVMCGLYSILPMEYYKRTMPRTVAAPAPAPDVDSSLLKESLNRLGYTLTSLTASISGLTTSISVLCSTRTGSSNMKESPIF